MKTLSAQYPRYGYRRIRIFLRRQGHELSWSRTHRLWRQAGLLLPKKRPRRRIATGRPRMHAPFKANVVWAYDFVFDWIFHPGREQAIRLLDLRRGDHVLEVGIGTGLNLPLYPGHCRITGIDLSEEMLEKAQDKVVELALSSVTLKAMDATVMDFGDSEFDAAVATYTISAVPDPVGVLREMRRVVKPGGNIVVLNHFETSNTFVLQKTPLAPGMLAPAKFNVGGKQYLVATYASDFFFVGNENLVPGAPFKPAKPGDILYTYGVGFGDVTPAVAPGVIPRPLLPLVAQVKFQFGPALVTPYFAGFYPNFIGLDLIALVVPDVPDGDHQITVLVNGQPLPQTLFLTVKR